MNTIEKRLLAKIRVSEETGCWEWMGSKIPRGYGKIRVDDKLLLAHRVAYELYRGPIPHGMLACHHCDNRACINPAHLFLGTQAENMKDRDAKGRRVAPSGPDHGNAKLSNDDVAAIRAAVGVTQQKLADRYGVGQDVVSRIRSGKAWHQPRKRTGDFTP